LIDPVKDDVSLYLASAYEIKNIADTYYRRKLSKNKVLEVTNAFSCIFCCPPGLDWLEYLKNNFSSVIENHMDSIKSNNNIPYYVQMLLNQGQDLREFNPEKISAIIREHNLYRVRNLAVLNARKTEIK
jgi:hypothetical protein